MKKLIYFTFLLIALFLPTISNAETDYDYSDLMADNYSYMSDISKYKDDIKKGYEDSVKKTYSESENLENEENGKNYKLDGTANIYHKSGVISVEQNYEEEFKDIKAKTTDKFYQNKPSHALIAFGDNFIYFAPTILLLIYFIFRYLGKIKSALLTGVCSGALFLYLNYTGIHNTQFICDKKNNNCTILVNSLSDKKFKKKQFFNISDIQDVQYKEVTKKNTRGVTDIERSIIFYYKNKAKEDFSDIFVTRDSQKNKDIVSSIKAYLKDDNENFYFYKTEESDYMIWLRVLIGFLMGSLAGYGICDKYIDRKK